MYSTSDSNKFNILPIIADYLGRPSSSMLEDAPFKAWTVERSVEIDLDEPLVIYSFKSNGLEFQCDKDERISVIFMFAEKFSGFPEYLLEIPFSTSRAQTLEHFGTPSKSGKKSNHPILGEYGPWDRFSRAGHEIHIRYRTNADSIQQITLMRDDVVP
jgi:hypothetical protein